MLLRLVFFHRLDPDLVARVGEKAGVILSSVDMETLVIFCRMDVQICWGMATTKQRAVLSHPFGRSTLYLGYVS